MTITKANVFALSVLAAFGLGGSVASSAPAALQYDEIVRVIVGQATPPPPGSFQTDLAAIMNPPPAQTAQQPARKHGLGNLLGAVLSGQNPIEAAAGDAADNALTNAMGGMLGPLNAFSAFMHQGKLARYALYKGWERVDDLGAHTATITKYDRHQIIESEFEQEDVPHYRSVGANIRSNIKRTFERNGDLHRAAAAAWNRSCRF